MAKKLWIPIVGLVVMAVSFGVLLLVGWTIGETRFERPDPGFDRLATDVEALPGVSVEARERWVEAPTFSRPRAYLDVAVDEAGLPGLLDAACASDLPDPVDWTLRVRADGGGVLSVRSDAPVPDPGGGGCLELGFDAPGLVEAVGRLDPDVVLQPTIWEDDQFALVAVEDGGGTLEDALPLVARAAELRDAAGLGSDRSVEINAPALGVVIGPDEHAGYLALLSGLVEEHGVTDLWADGGGTPVDGVRKVQVTVPPEERAAVEARIRASGLGIADLPVRFLPDEASSGDRG